MQSTATLEEIVGQAKLANKPVDRVTAAFTLGFLSGKAFARAQKVGAGKTVCVTGASGFVASHCVQQLLAAGYTVHGTVRSLSDPLKVAHLTSLAGASDRLKLFQANLVDEGSFDEAVKGCDAVLHTASPFTTDKSYKKDDFIVPAVQGTLYVLNSLKKHGVKICVLTSSTAAVYCFNKEHGPDKVYTDTDWSDAEMLEQKTAWYALSKTVAERRAHEFAAANGIVLKACNPTYIFGPRLQPSVNESTKGVLRYLDGTETEIQFGSKCICDVRDVARAHILAYQKVERDGGDSFGNRVVVITKCPKWTEIVAAIATAVPESHADKVTIPKTVAEQGPPPAIPDFIQFDCVNARSIGLQFTPWEQTVADTVDSIVQHGDL